MKPKLILCFALVLIAGCATQKDDARLQGTWCLNRNATMAVSSNTPPRVVWVEYNNGAVVVKNDEAQYGYGNVSFHYHVVEHGSNYVVICTTAPQDKQRDIHIRFVDADTGYWIDSVPLGFGIQERFDKLVPKPDAEPAPPGMDGIISPQPIPLDQ